METAQISKRKLNKIKKKTRALSDKLHAKDKGYKSASNVEFVLFIIGLVITLLVIRAFVFEPVMVDGESMQNTLQDGERCIVEKVSYWLYPPKSGDIVIVHFPGRGSESFVKRVIATGGQTIELREELVVDPDTYIGKSEYRVYIDGEILDESAYADSMLFDPIFYSSWDIEFGEDGVYTVPEGYVFVMGDHRTNSRDSRSVGPIPLSSVVGRVHGVLYPFDKARLVD